MEDLNSPHLYYGYLNKNLKFSEIHISIVSGAQCLDISKTLYYDLNTKYKEGSVYRVEQGYLIKVSISLVSPQPRATNSTAVKRPLNSSE